MPSLLSIGLLSISTYHRINAWVKGVDAKRRSDAVVPNNTSDGSLGVFRLSIEGRAQGFGGKIKQSEPRWLVQMPGGLHAYAIGGPLGWQDTVVQSFV